MIRERDFKVMSEGVLYFGYGANRNPQMMKAIVGREPLGFAAAIEGYELCIQSWGHIPPKAQKLLKPAWGPGFKSYLVRPKMGGKVRGRVWFLTKEERRFIDAWELTGIWYNPVVIYFVDGAGRARQIEIQIINDQRITDIVDGEKYPSFIGSKSKMLRVAEEVQRTLSLIETTTDADTDIRLPWQLVSAYLSSYLYLKDKGVDCGPLLKPMERSLKTSLHYDMRAAILALQVFQAEKKEGINISKQMAEWTRAVKNMEPLEGSGFYTEYNHLTEETRRQIVAMLLQNGQFKDASCFMQQHNPHDLLELAKAQKQYKKKYSETLIRACDAAMTWGEETTTIFIEEAVKIGRSDIAESTHRVYERKLPPFLKARALVALATIPERAGDKKGANYLQRTKEELLNVDQNYGWDHLRPGNNFVIDDLYLDLCSRAVTCAIGFRKPELAVDFSNIAVDWLMKRNEYAFHRLLKISQICTESGFDPTPYLDRIRAAAAKNGEFSHYKLVEVIKAEKELGKDTRESIVLAEQAIQDIQETNGFLYAAESFMEQMDKLKVDYDRSSLRRVIADRLSQLDSQEISVIARQSHFGGHREVYFKAAIMTGNFRIAEQIYAEQSYYREKLPRERDSFKRSEAEQLISSAIEFGENDLALRIAAEYDEETEYWNRFHNRPQVQIYCQQILKAEPWEEVLRQAHVFVMKYEREQREKDLENEMGMFLKFLEKEIVLKLAKDCGDNLLDLGKAVLEGSGLKINNLNNKERDFVFQQASKSFGETPSGSTKDIRWAFEILGLSSEASRVEIRTAYRKIVKETHPDKNPANSKQAIKKFIDATEAFEILIKLT